VCFQLSRRRGTFLPWIEEDIFSVEVEDGNVVVQLACVKVARIEECLAAVDHFHGPDFEAGGACESDKEQGHVVVGSALLLPDVLSAFDGLELLGLALGLRFCAAEAGVVELHDSGIDLARLLFFGVGRGDDLGESLLDLAGGIGEALGTLGPGFGLAIPEVFPGVSVGVVELDLPFERIQGRIQSSLEWRGCLRGRR